jgi:WD40 repeat protein
MMQRTAFLIISAGLVAPGFCASDLLVCSLLSDQVLRFDGTTGALLGVFADTHIDGPEGITVGPDGNIYVASEYSANVTKWSPTGTYLGEFVAPSGGWEDLQFGPDGNLYTIAHFGTPDGPISKWDGTTGAYLGQWGAGAPVSHQHGLTFGPDGNPYFGHEIFGPVGSIGKIDQSSGAYAGNVATDSRIDGIFDLVFKDGIIYTDDFFTGAVHKFDSTTGAYLGDFITGTSDAVSWGMIFHTDGFLYVSGGGHVWRYDAATGAFHDTFAIGISGAAGMAFVEVVPEPNSVFAFALGLPLLLRRRRRS